MNVLINIASFMLASLSLLHVCIFISLYLAVLCFSPLKVNTMEPPYIMLQEEALSILWSYFFHMEVCTLLWSTTWFELLENIVLLFLLPFFNQFMLFEISANALQMNDYGQTPLDVARAKGHTSVVRAIEVHSTCLLPFLQSCSLKYTHIAFFSSMQIIPFTFL